MQRVVHVAFTEVGSGRRSRTLPGGGKRARFCNPAALQSLSTALEVLLSEHHELSSCSDRTQQWTSSQLQLHGSC